jgi:hypothetical protein
LPQVRLAENQRFGATSISVLGPERDIDFYYLDLLTKDDRRILSWSSDNTLRLCGPWR